MRFEDGTEIQGRSMNVSLGGMFIATEALRPVGSSFAVEFRLTEGGRLIQGQGRVLWSREEPEGEEYPRGVGVRFLELTPGSRELIFEVVDRHVRDTDPADVDSASDRQRAAAAPAVGSLSLEEMPEEALDEVHPATLDAAIEEAVDREMVGPSASPPEEDPAEGLARVVGDEKPVTPADFARPFGSEAVESAGVETAAWASPANFDAGEQEPEAEENPAEEPPAAPFAFDDAPPKPLARSPETPAAFEDSPNTARSGVDSEPERDELGSDDVLSAVAPQAAGSEPVEAPSEAVESWQGWDESERYRKPSARPWYRSPWLPGALVVALALLAAGWWFGLRESGETESPAMVQPAASDATGPAGGDADTANVAGGDAGTGDAGTLDASNVDAGVADGETDEAPIENVAEGTADPEFPDPAAPAPGEAVQADSAVDAVPATTEIAAEPSVPSEPARMVTGITWQRQGPETVIVVQGDGVLAEGAVLQSRLGGANPRQLIRLIGIEGPFADGTVEVGSAEVARIRTGHHAEKNPDELHVVVDLVDPAVELAAVEPLGDRLRLRFRKP